MRTLRIWGLQPVREALRAGTAHRVLVANERRSSAAVRELAHAAERQGTVVQYVPIAELARLVRSQNAQGVAAEISLAGSADLTDLLSAGSEGRSPLFLALDQIQDPHNLGAILRSADAAGVQGVILPEHGSAPLTGVVGKTSAGALSHISIAYVPNLARALAAMRDSGVWIVGLDGEATGSLYAVDLTVPTALVVGSEGGGLRRLTRECCDVLAAIPMRGHVRSLNAAVAASVALFETVRQRSDAETAETRPLK